ncbi:DUF302 domain-containing protein [Sulfuriflexus mobilis]|uniref:DUF302 domain-containing protein n=1 Tax=Sulfuriflexus mobilis TaxID=1811807 RepID=UPI001559FF43|nr:DUF302 domain-containing protein [Sulfuriflexus mobilis]
MKKLFLIVIFSLWGLMGASQVCLAGSGSVFTAEVKADFETTYTKVYKALEQNRFFVVFEPDIGANLSGFAERWGKDYNQNKLERIKSMVFCNGWYANQVSNADPDMLALCPLSLTMTHKDGVTRVLFIRPDRVARGTKAEKIAGELTRGVIEAINEGLK